MTSKIVFNKTSLEDLKRVINPLDKCPLECDGMCHVIGHHLRKLDVDYQIYVQDNHTDIGFIFHYWIEIVDQEEDLWGIDYRFTTWFQTPEGIPTPHGIFRMTPELRTLYTNCYPVEFPIFPEGVYTMMAKGFPISSSTPAT